MNWAATLVLLALLGAAPAPLVVGSVHDQHGAPVGGARVALLVGNHIVGSATTAEDGTFSAPGLADHVRVSCNHCQPADIAVAADGSAVGIVQRYDAIANDTPTSDDLANLPYSRVESELSLAPFVVLNQTSRTIPGAWLNDRNALPQIGLVLLNGVPDYDIVAGVTPFDTIPARDTSSISVTRLDDAYTYGDLANAGSFEINTTDGSSYTYGGADTGARVQSGIGADDASAAWSNWQGGDRRDRADFDETFATQNLHGDVELSSGDGDLSPGHASALDDAFSSARASIEGSGNVDYFATALIDRGSYNYESRNFPAGAIWSDADMSVGIRSHAVIAPFTLFDVRSSTGSYVTQSSGPIAATLGQARGVAGLEIAQNGNAAEFTVGSDDVTYAGGYPGALVNNRSTATSSASLDLELAPQWTFHASDNHGYALQTFLTTFGPQAPDDPNPIDTISTAEATLDFDSLQRLRASATVLRSLDALGQTTSSAGASLGWQIAPAISLRTWLLREDTAGANSQLVGSSWLTYETSSFRLDAIWRRDILDKDPDAHLDGDVSGRLSDRMRWFVSSERRAGIRATDLGIRF